MKSSGSRVVIFNYSKLLLLLTDSCDCTLLPQVYSQAKVGHLEHHAAAEQHVLRLDVPAAAAAAAAAVRDYAQMVHTVSLLPSSDLMRSHPATR
jgi:hypothetical protein